MTSSDIDFKSRQQLELLRFREMWQADDVTNTMISEIECESAIVEIHNILQLIQNILKIEFVGYQCEKTEQSIYLHDGKLRKKTSKFIPDLSLLNEVHVLDEGNRASSLALCRSKEAAEGLEKTDYLACFSVGSDERVFGQLILAHKAAKKFGVSDVQSLKIFLALLASSLSRVSQDVGVKTDLEISSEIARLQKAFECKSGEIFVLNVQNFRLLMVNSRARQRLGYSDLEIESLEFTDLCGISKEQLGLHLELLQSEPQQEITFETSIKPKDGEPYPVRVTFSLDVNGKFPVLIFQADENTDHKKKRTDFVSSTEHKLAALAVSREAGIGLEAVFDGVGGIADFIVRRAKLGKFSFLVDDSRNLIGQPFSEVFSTKRAKGFFENCVRVLSTDTLEIFEQDFEAENGIEWFRVSAIRVGDNFLQLGLRCISEKKRRDQAFIELHELSTNLGIETDDYINKMLHAGRIALGMEYAKLAIVKENGIETTHLDGWGDKLSVGEFIDRGDSIFLSNNLLGGPFFLNNLNFILDKQKLTLQAYVAASLDVSGEQSSFVSFMSSFPKDKDFDDFEVGIVSVIAKLISQRLTLDKTRQELESSRDELQLIFDNVPARIWRKDNKNKYLTVNKAAAELFDLTPNEMKGKHLRELVNDLDESILDVDRRVLKTGKAEYGIEVRGLLGKWPWERIDVVPVRGSSSEKDGLLVICSDISKQKEAEEQLAAAIGDLEEANRNLAQFNAVVSHDLKAPLRHMRMLSELLLADADAGSEAAEYANHIRENAEHCQAMIDALNTLSNITRSELNPKITSIEQIVRSLSAVMGVKLDEIDGKICCEELPVVPVDAELVSNLFQNLIENSIKYRSDKPLRINISADQSADIPVFSVSDNGAGIESDYRNSIFEVFTRLVDEDFAEKGEGVGLSICRRIVERHGGKIWLDTEFKDGACFKFTLTS